MTPYEEARKAYESDGQIFQKVLRDYLEHYYVYCSPECIIFAKPVDNSYWLIEYAFGKGCAKRFFDMMPFYLPKVAWARGLRDKQKPLKLFSTDRLAGML